MTNSFPHRKLVLWYQKNKRRLPWRENQDPYRVWISEIMLQQTQVENVIPFYLRFLKRFPNLASLARASEQTVLALWSGLGYYSRARNLLKAAGIVRKTHRGKFPRTSAELLNLPGIGPYTSGAILSIAFDEPAAIFDGNVRRVLSRFYCSGNDQALQARSEALVREAHRMRLKPSGFNQALMELGALICAPKNPLCGLCPVRESCEAKKKNLQTSFPESSKSAQTVRKAYALAVLSSPQDPKKILLVRRSNRTRWLKGLWELPMVSSSRLFENSKRFGSVERKLRRILGLPLEITGALGTVKHSITHHRLRISVLKGRIQKSTRALPENSRWASINGMKSLSSSSILTKALALDRE